MKCMSHAYIENGVRVPIGSELCPNDALPDERYCAACIGGVYLRTDRDGNIIPGYHESRERWLDKTYPRRM